MPSSRGAEAVRLETATVPGLEVVVGGRPPGPVAAVDSARLAILLLIGASSMLFGSLLSALVIFRGSSLAWPPPGQPYLPISVTTGNTLVLLASAGFVYRAGGAVRRGERDALLSSLRRAAALGTVFLAVQGVEWARLIGHGLTLQSSTYGATFYTLIGAHAVHVASAVLWLLAVLRWARRGSYSSSAHAGIDAFATYWYFLCGLWLLLFGAVYLA